MAASNERSYLRLFWTIWAIASVVLDVVVWVFVGPHTPPGTLTETAKSDQFDFNVLLMFAIPVLIGVWMWLAFAIRFWNAKRGGPDPVGGEAARTNKAAQVSWIGITSFVVLFLAGFGTWALVVDHGSGGGEGPNPVWAPSGAIKAETAAATGKSTWKPGEPLVVQVIGQQWRWTYRYPQFGGFESQQIYLPADTTIVFNVTSLDVIHDFWAYQLSVKADANPGFNNVAFTETKGTGSFVVRCDELCGIWHGAMYNYGKVVSQSDFQNWATTTEAANAQNTKYLPAFNWVYTPDANGASGGVYPDGNVTPYSPYDTYGAKQPAS